MNSDYTHLTMVVDRSGSMQTILSDAQGGLDLLLNDQFAQPGRFTLTLVQFDTVHDEVARMTTARPDYHLKPRGATALLDAVGRAITITGEDLAALPEDERPVHVLFCVVTDGEENSSEEWTLETLRAKIDEQKTTYGWHFLFTGADDTKWQGEQLGMASASYATATPGSSTSNYANISRATTGIRTNSMDTYQVDDVQ